ncbi:hypothetical protein PINS_up007950 [Pythium insidiosum]|nr:hypothetical protein PINS_up007950 [Pythium insidiosum]
MSTPGAPERSVSKTGLLGIASTHFDAVLLVREAIQCLLQTYHCYVLSRWLPRPHLDRIFVACIVGNCWSTPMVSRLLVHHHLPRQCVWCLAFDVALDFVSTAVLLTAIFVSSAAAVDVAENNFSADSYVVGSFLIHVTTEFQIFWVQSWLDLTLRALFALNLLHSAALVAIAAFSWRCHVAQALATLGHNAFLAGGALVPVCHLYAASRPGACMANVQAIVRIARAQLPPRLAGVVGAESDVDRIHAGLNDPSLVFVYLRHSEALDVSPRARRLRHLMGLFIHRSTL